MKRKENRSAHRRWADGPGWEGKEEKEEEKGKEKEKENFWCAEIKIKS